MAVFWEPSPDAQNPLAPTFRLALLATPPPESEADGRANELAQASNPTPPATLKVGRIVFALVLVALFAGAGVWTDSAGLTDSSKALFGIATTAFGVVVGLVTGEKPAGH